MKKWQTTLHALDPRTGEYCEWFGPVIEAPSMELAKEYCENNGLGYCIVEGELVGEYGVDEEGGPDFSKKVDFTLPEKN